LFSVINVQNQDLFAPLLLAAHDHRTRLASLVPPRLGDIFTAVQATI
jgi:hypothetical protein